MNGVHDMGGMHGFGPIVREENEPLFHAPWEGRVRALANLAMDQDFFNLDAFRYGIERMEPADYLRSPYFERWLATLEYNLMQEGFLTNDELAARTEHLRQHPERTPSSYAGAAELQSAPVSPPEPGQPPPAPRFAVGDAVVTRNFQPPGHTRLPRYARGKRGVIERLLGVEILPDTNAHGLGEHPQPTYAVRFDARELWGESAEPRQTVSLDLWESYLEPAPR
jgi:nitrile hydratase subunit beta